MTQSKEEVERALLIDMINELNALAVGWFREFCNQATLSAEKRHETYGIYVGVQQATDALRIRLRKLSME